MIHISNFADLIKEGYILSFETIGKYATEQIIYLHNIKTDVKVTTFIKKYYKHNMEYSKRLKVISIYPETPLNWGIVHIVVEEV